MSTAPIACPPSLHPVPLETEWRLSTGANLLAAAAFAVAVCAPAASLAEMPVRVATWTIDSLNDKSREPLRPGAPIRADEDYGLLSEYRARLGADVVALQGIGSAAAVARVFPAEEYEIIFSGRFDPANTGHSHAALAVRKGKVEVVASGIVEGLSVIDVEENLPTRPGVEALLEVDGERFWVMSIDMKSGCFAKSLEPAILGDCKTLAKQVAPLDAWIDDKQSTGLAVIIMGKFNRKLDVGGQSDPLWSDIDDGLPAGLNLWRLPFQTASRCPTTRELHRREPIDFLVFNQAAWDKVDQQSFFELLYDFEVVELGYRLSDHCPQAVEISIGAPTRAAVVGSPRS
jgi:hypothetical protein